MLLFLCVDKSIETREDVVVPAAEHGDILLFRDVEEALDRCNRNALFVINVFKLEDTDVPIAQNGSDELRVPYLPVSAVLNREHRLPIRPIRAGGGLVVRFFDDVLNVLLIFRKGVWDLPKGKLDEGESPREGALREVREEIGVTDLTIDQHLGYTTHGYVEEDQYCVKTTQWYLMTTSETDFTPQASERIEKVCWQPWDKAKEMVGYRVLRRQMQRAEPLIYETGVQRVS